MTVGDPTLTGWEINRGIRDAGGWTGLNKFNIRNSGELVGQGKRYNRIAAAQPPRLLIGDLMLQRLRIDCEQGGA